MVYKYTQTLPEIEIQLKNGIYILPGLRPCGKTRLYQALSRLGVGYKNPDAAYDDNLSPKDVLTYDYEIYQLHKRNDIMLKNYLVNDNLKVVMIDRYEMFMGVCKEELIKKSESAIVLISCKSDRVDFSGLDELCEIDATEKKIKVYDVSDDDYDSGIHYTEEDIKRMLEHGSSDWASL
jgi:hypothetical protein